MLTVICHILYTSPTGLKYAIFPPSITGLKYAIFPHLSNSFNFSHIPHLSNSFNLIHIPHLSYRFLAPVVVPDIRPEVLVGVEKLGQEPGQRDSVT